MQKVAPLQDEGSSAPDLRVVVPQAPRVVVLERPADLEFYRDAWQVLVDQALEPNVFYHPSLLLPSLRAFAPAADLALVLVLAEPPESARKPEPPQLLGLFPLVRQRAGSDWPVSRLRLWTGDYSYVPVPLLHRGRAAAALAAFFDWFETQRRSTALLEIERLPLGGPVHALLVDEIGRRGAHRLVTQSYTRAVCEPEGSAETYLERVFPSKDRREIARQRKRLQELGKSEIVELGPKDDAPAWAEEFLALEKRGWKGQHGTALGSRETDASYFREMFLGGHAAGVLSSTALRVDGKPLAMQIMLHNGPGAYGFKTAYDESYSRYAPGLQLEIDLIEKLVRDPARRWLDSAAASDHPLFNRIYGERRPIENWLITTEPAVGLALSLVPLYRWCKRTLRTLRPKKQ